MEDGTEGTTSAEVSSCRVMTGGTNNDTPTAATPSRPPLPTCASETPSLSALSVYMSAQSSLSSLVDEVVLRSDESWKKPTVKEEGPAVPDTPAPSPSAPSTVERTPPETSHGNELLRVVRPRYLRPLSVDLTLKVPQDHEHMRRKSWGEGLASLVAGRTPTATRSSRQLQLPTPSSWKSLPHEAVNNRSALESESDAHVAASTNDFLLAIDSVPSASTPRARCHTRHDVLQMEMEKRQLSRPSSASDRQDSIGEDEGISAPIDEVSDTPSPDARPLARMIQRIQLEEGLAVGSPRRRSERTESTEGSPSPTRLSSQRSSIESIESRLPMPSRASFVHPTLHQGSILTLLSPNLERRRSPRDDSDIEMVEVAPPPLDVTIPSRVLRKDRRPSVRPFEADAGAGVLASIPPPRPQSIGPVDPLPKRPRESSSRGSAPHFLSSSSLPGWDTLVDKTSSSIRFSSLDLMDRMRDHMERTGLDLPHTLCRAIMLAVGAEGHVLVLCDFLSPSSNVGSSAVVMGDSVQEGGDEGSEASEQGRALMSVARHLTGFAAFHLRMSVSTQVRALLEVSLAASEALASGDSSCVDLETAHAKISSSDWEDRHGSVEVDAKRRARRSAVLSKTEMDMLELERARLPKSVHEQGRISLQRSEVDFGLLRPVAGLDDSTGLLQERGREEKKPEKFRGAVIVVEDIHLAPLLTLRALSEAIALRRITDHGTTRFLEDGIVFVCTSPSKRYGGVEYHVRDRFLVHVFATVPLQPPQPRPKITPVYPGEDIDHVREAVLCVHVGTSMHQYMRDLLHHVRTRSMVADVLSPRALVCLEHAVRVAAVLSGMEYVAPAHVHSVASMVLGHRTAPSDPSEACGDWIGCALDALSPPV